MIILLYIIKEQPGLAGETRRARVPAAWPRRARGVLGHQSRLLLVNRYS